MIYELTYISRQIETLSFDDLHKILTKARIHNEKNGITGVLLYKDGYFIQVLEGNKFTLNELFVKIKNDPRHIDISEPMLKAKRKRVFGGWSMGLKLIDEMRDPDDIEKLNDFMNPEISTKELKSRDKEIYTLLSLFEEMTQQLVQ